MIYHTIRVSFLPEVRQAEIQDILDRLAAMGREIPGVQHFCVGQDVGGEFAYGATYALTDLDAYRAYMTSPAHHDVVVRGLPLTYAMSSHDLTDSNAPEIGAKLVKIQRERMEQDPEILGAVAGLAHYSGSYEPSKSARERLDEGE